MNILLISQPRSKGTAFGDLLSKQNSASFLSEPFTDSLNHYKNADSTTRKLYINKVIDRFNQQVFNSNKNHVVKLQPTDFGNLAQYLGHLNLQSYDKIYMLKRIDFFETACSIQLAQTMHYWGDSKVISKQTIVSLSKAVIRLSMYNVYRYLLIKKYLTENNIPFIKVSYETLPDNLKSRVKPSGLTYSELIENYYIKEDINSIFAQSFNYDTCYINIENFLQSLEKIYPDK